jgi:hypothetical protein
LKEGIGQLSVSKPVLGHESSSPEIKCVEKEKEIEVFSTG